MKISFLQIIILIVILTSFRLSAIAACDTEKDVDACHACIKKCANDLVYSTLNTERKKMSPSEYSNHYTEKFVKEMFYNARFACTYEIPWWGRTGLNTCFALGRKCSGCNPDKMLKGLR